MLCLNIIKSDKFKFSVLFHCLISQDSINISSLKTSAIRRSFLKEEQPQKPSPSEAPPEPVQNPAVTPELPALPLRSPKATPFRTTEASGRAGPIHWLPVGRRVEPTGKPDFGRNCHWPTIYSIGGGSTQVVQILRRLAEGNWHGFERMAEFGQREQRGVHGVGAEG